jgi:hypothetical protein
MKIILNKTKKSSQRYTLINEPMGCYCDPARYPTHKYSIANGVDKGKGYQEYQSLTNFLIHGDIEIKNELIKILKSLGYKQYLIEQGF